MAVNEWLPKPTSPGRWVDAHRCSTCDEAYADFNFFGTGRRGSSAAFAAGVLLVRHHNSEPAGGGYRSRGPVLWAARTLKLCAWYERHMDCGTEARAPAPERTTWAAWSAQNLPAEDPTAPLSW